MYFYKSYRLEAGNFIDKEALVKVLLVNFAKYFKNIFLQNTSGRLVLVFQSYCVGWLS